MKILALDISSATGSAAVAAGGAVVQVRNFACPRGRGGEVFAVLEELRPAWVGLGTIAVGIGPGSYNGLRTACALAGAFQDALGIRVVAAPSPCLLGVDEDHYFAAGDARGGMVYLAEVRGRRLAGDIRMVAREEFLAMVAGGFKVMVYRVGGIAGAEALPEAHPDAAVLARLAPSLDPAEPGGPEPIYLKPPHITTPRA
mgnify:CR=1 FL=1